MLLLNSSVAENFNDENSSDIYNMKKRTALVFGSTGLVGSLLLEELIVSDVYSRIKIFVRKPVKISNSKVEEILIDFSAPESYSTYIEGDDLYICTGTTIKKAGSIAEFEKTDRDLPVKLASIAKTNGIEKIAVISSIGANSASGNYYLRTKGVMEQAVIELQFNHCVIARPSMLLGQRDEKRIGESIGKVLMKILNPILSGRLRKYRAIHGRDVARGMIAALQEGSIKTIYESDELQKLADEYLK
jgi:uncharacterized protein YbjT (DUF2867 family)